MLDLRDPPLGAPGGSEVVVLLPTLNEEKGLVKTLGDIPFDHLRAAGFSPTVLVVDGGSVDRTTEVAADWGACVLRQTGRGKGSATREGLEWARAHGAEFVVVLDADFTYPGSGIPPLLALLRAGSDLVVGVRRPEYNPLGVVRNLIHRVGDGLLNYAAAQLSRSPILDICSGLWGVRTSIVPRLGLVSTGFEVEAEVFLKSFRLGYRVTQIPIAYRARIGEAKLHALRDGARIFLAIVRHSRLKPAMSDLPVGGLPAPPTVTESIRSLQAICYATAARELVIFSTAGRVSEAEELARSLRNGGVGVRVEVSEYDPLAQSVLGMPSPLPLHAAGLGGGNVPVVITLPSTVPGHAPVPAAVVGLPNSGRLVYVPFHLPTSPPAVELGRSGGYRLEFAERRRPRSWQILGATLDGSGRWKELAMLTANAASESVRVYRSLDPNDAGRDGLVPDHT